MRNSYPGRRHMRPQAGVKVLGHKPRDAEYGSFWTIGFLLLIGITCAVKRALDL